MGFSHNSFGNSRRFSALHFPLFPTSLLKAPKTFSSSVLLLCWIQVDVCTIYICFHHQNIRIGKVLYQRISTFVLCRKHICENISATQFLLKLIKWTNLPFYAWSRSCILIRFRIYIKKERLMSSTIKQTNNNKEKRFCIVWMT